ncbi:YtcA family lipoprotein [Tunturiibacter psychrotolerans]|uniref:YtcA family lipoprotein n=1 Tax=Tunturiibacter psychrotolerans TaxID=3069686 RepID=UPI00333FF3C8
MNCPRGSRVTKYGSMLTSLLLTGCGRAPTFDVVGSFFPAWLFCLAASILLTVLTRWLFQRLRVAVAPQILIYPSLTAAFAFALWLIFFR